MWFLGAKSVDCFGCLSMILCHDLGGGLLQQCHVVMSLECYQAARMVEAAYTADRVDNPASKITFSLFQSQFSSSFCWRDCSP